MGHNNGIKGDGKKPPRLMPGYVLKTWQGNYKNHWRNEQSLVLFHEQKRVMKLMS
jgi:hypothetical protein